MWKKNNNGGILAEVNAIYYITSRIHNIFMSVSLPTSSVVYFFTVSLWPQSLFFFFSDCKRPEETTVTT